jgi:hypothetical protein
VARIHCLGGLEEFNRIVSAYLDLAENRAQRGIAMNMKDWASFLDRFLELSDLAAALSCVQICSSGQPAIVLLPEPGELCHLAHSQRALGAEGRDRRGTDRRNSRGFSAGLRFASAGM